MKRFLVIAAAASTLSCASAMQAAQSVGNGDTLGMVDAVGHAASETKGLHDALAKCDELKDVVVPYQEERSIGGAIAVKAVATGGGLWIDATSDSSEAHLAHPETLANYPEGSPVNRMTREVAKVGAALGARSTRPEIFWTFGVLKDDRPNAFSTPGGYVFVSRGLLKELTSENQLAGVLAHEITHVALRHGVAAYLDSKVDACKKAAWLEEGSGAGKAVAEKFVSGMGMSTQQYLGIFRGVMASKGHEIDFDKDVNRPLLKKLADEVTERLEAGFARDLELKADEGAVELELNAGYDPQPFIDLVQSLPATDGAKAQHPSGEDRKTAMVNERKQLAGNPFIDTSKLRKAVALNEDITSVVSGKVAAGDAP